MTITPSLYYGGWGRVKNPKKDYLYLEIRNKSCILVTSNNLDIVSESKARGVFVFITTYFVSPLVPLKQNKDTNGKTTDTRFRKQS